jgi:hypothetical protein
VFLLPGGRNRGAFCQVGFDGSLRDADNHAAAFAGPLAPALLPVEALIALASNVGFGAVGTLLSAFFLSSFFGF